MASFNQSRYEIYLPKDTDGTPNEPVSPTNEISTSPTNNRSMIRKGALIAVGAVVARRAVNTIRSEISASTGNERLEIKINSALKGVGYIAMAATGPVGMAAVGADMALGAISYFRENERENRFMTIERRLKGRRNDIASGSVYYD